MRDTYLQRTCRTIIATFALIGLARCNIEVGNPDSNLPEPTRVVQNISFNLAAGSPCETNPAPCIAVPVSSGDAQQPLMSYEMNDVRFQLSEIQFLPYVTEPKRMELNLLSGSMVTITDPKAPGSVTGLSMRFDAGATPGASSFTLDGNFVTQVNGQQLVIPLSISFPDAILAESAVAAGGEDINAVVFDAAVWFDFTDVDLTKVVKDLTGGVCKDPQKPACTKHREKMAAKISSRISKSLSIKTKSGKKIGSLQK